MVRLTSSGQVLIQIPKASFELVGSVPTNGWSEEQERPWWFAAKAKKSYKPYEVVGDLEELYADLVCSKDDYELLVQTGEMSRSTFQMIKRRIKALESLAKTLNLSLEEYI